MSLSSYGNKFQYVGDGVTREFAFSAPVIAKDHLRVFLRNTDGLENESPLDTPGGHTIQLEQEGDAGARVSFDSAPAAGVRVVIKRQVPLLQPYEYSTGDSFPAESHERALDLRAMAEQQLQETLQRTLRAAETEQGDGSALILPVEQLRAGKLLAFDETGAATVGLDLSAGQSVVQNIAAIQLAADNIAAIQDAPNQAADAADSASAAAVSEGNAVTSANSAADSAANAANSATAAASSAASAANSASNAAASESAAVASETNAAALATLAGVHSNTAELWAISDNPIQPGIYSAKHYAEESSALDAEMRTRETNAAASAAAAAASEANAAASATASAASEVNAAASVTAAAASEANAAASAAAAATFDPALYVAKGANITELVNNAGYITSPDGGDAALLQGQNGAFYRNAGNLNAGTIADARLPGRLNTTATTIADWNSANENGFYMGNAAANAPTTGVWCIGWVTRHNGSYIQQHVEVMTGGNAGELWFRRMASGVWQPWIKLHEADGSPGVHGFTQSLSASSAYTVMPNGLIVQSWTDGYAGEDPRTSAYPIAFPNAVVSVTGQAAWTVLGRILTLADVTVSSCQFRLFDANGVRLGSYAGQIHFIAVGY